MKRRIRAAILGFGRMGQRHFRAFRREGIHVEGVCDLFPEKVRQALPGFPEAGIYRRAEELLKAGPWDVASVATTADSHADLVIRLAEAGVRRILCEKPIATRLADAQRMVRVCRRRGVRLAVNHVRRWSPNHDILRRLLRRDGFGPVRQIYCQVGCSGLGNWGTHFLDAMRMYFQADPLWAAGWIDRTGTPNPRGSRFVDPGGFGVFGFPGGRRGFLDTSEDSGVGPRMEITTAHGRITLEEYLPRWDLQRRRAPDRRMPLTRNDLPLRLVFLGRPERFDLERLTARAIRNLLSEKPISCTGEDGRWALEMAVAVHASDAAGHRPVRFPLARRWRLRRFRFA